MKVYLIAALLFCAAFQSNAQNGNAEFIADKIAIKLKDSLQLSNEQKSQLYDINMQLHNQKMNIRQTYSNTESKVPGILYTGKF
jgi:hypothetical protein